jgi:acylphosphatase
MTTDERDRPEPQAVRLLVRGRVQGVGFRYFIIQRAQEFGVVGFARNLGDGSVEIWAEGSPSALSRLVDAARRGPRWGRVDEVEVRGGDATHAFRGFGVRF